MNNQLVRRVVATVIDDQAKDQIIAVARDVAAGVSISGEPVPYDQYDELVFRIRYRKSFVMLGIAVILFALLGAAFIYISDASHKYLYTALLIPLGLLGQALSDMTFGYKNSVIDAVRSGGQVICQQCQGVNFCKEPWVCEACTKENGLEKDSTSIVRTWKESCIHCGRYPAFLWCCHCAQKIPLTSGARNPRGAHRVGFTPPAIVPPVASAEVVLQQTYERIINEAIARQKMDELELQGYLHTITKNEVAFNEAMSKITADPRYKALDNRAKSRITESATRALLQRLREAEKRLERRREKKSPYDT